MLPPSTILTEKTVAAPGFKKWGGKKGATIDYGGANMCA